MSLFVAAILGGLVSQGISRWMPEAQAQEAKVQDEVRAKRLVVVDDAGRNRIVLSVGNAQDLGGMLDTATISILGPKLLDGPALHLLSDRETTCMKLGIEKQDGRVSTFPMSLFAFRTGETVLKMKGKDMENRSIVMSVEKDGSPSLLLSDGSDGQPTMAALGVLELETPKTGATKKTQPSSLILFGKDGKILWRAP